MENIGWLSLLPPVLAISLALWKKRVLPALFLGVFSSLVILNLDKPLLAPFATLEHMVKISGEPGNLKIIFFSLMMGGFLKLIKDANGFKAFAHAIERRQKQFSPKTAYSLTSVLGISLFLEGWSNLLINSTVVSPLYDRLKISRQRMAYFIHTIGCCVVAMVPVNGWAAFYMGLLRGQGIEQPFEFLLGSIPFMLYCWISLILVFVVMTTGFTIGPMKQFDQRAWEGQSTDQVGNEDSNNGITPRTIYMIVPILTMVIGVITSLYLTGNGSISQGKGASSILYGVMLGIVAIIGLLLYFKALNFIEIEKRFVKGMAEFFDVAILLVLALTIGDLCKALGTGVFVGQIAQDALPIQLMPALIFALGAGISFATGTSYGTFSILTPIAIPLALATNTDPMLMFGACIAGGLFGDNCSPISDSTIITSVGAKVKVIDHVQTQLPYALISGAITLLGFVVLGYLRW